MNIFIVVNEHSSLHESKRKRVNLANRDDKIKFKKNLVLSINWRLFLHIHIEYVFTTDLSLKMPFYRYIYNLMSSVSDLIFLTNPTDITSHLMVILM